jgi:hypothetical protein
MGDSERHKSGGVGPNLRIAEKALIHAHDCSSTEKRRFSLGRKALNIEVIQGHASNK